MTEEQIRRLEKLVNYDLYNLLVRFEVAIEKLAAPAEKTK